MLKTLKIKNVALIKDLELDFDKAFNVLMGETGAGKSIIFDALGFALGDKADKNLLRTGEHLMRVSASFTTESLETKELLKEYGIEDEGLIILTRTMSADGRTDNRINGNLVTGKMLKAVAETLVDTYGQHESTMLLNTKNHLGLLEALKPSYLDIEKERLRVLLNEYKNVLGQMKDVGGSFENRERELELLTFQIDEIENISPKDGEDDELSSRLLELSNAERIGASLSQANSLLDSTGGVTAKLKEALRALTSVSQYGERIKGVAERLSSSLLELQDISEEVESIASDLVFDEAEFERVDKRLDDIKALKRKFGGSIEEVKNYLVQAKEKRQSLENAEELLGTLSKEKTRLEGELYKLSKEITKKRKEMALELEEKMKVELAQLGMKNSRLKVDFKNEINEFKEDIAYTANGLDDVEFLFSANAGESLKPLGKTISGGEMSRFMLALKNILAEKSSVETLVFDEVDTGISGEVGNAVARKIATLSKKYQVLCISHLPQVCAMADKYVFVTKISDGKETETKARILNLAETIEKLSALSTGQNASKASLEYAKELKQRAEEFKKMQA